MRDVLKGWLKVLAFFAAWIALGIAWRHPVGIAVILHAAMFWALWYGHTVMLRDAYMDGYHRGQEVLKNEIARQPAAEEEATP